MDKSINVVRPHVFPNIEDWPISKLSDDRKNFVRDLTNFTLELLLEKHTAKNLGDIISKTVYLEKIRMKKDPWKVDPSTEKKFWAGIEKRQIELNPNADESETLALNMQLLREIVHRYSEEIVGTFSIKVFLFMRKFLTMFFSRLLNAARAKSIFSFWGSKHRLSDRMIVKGEIEKVRKLMKRGTVVIVPTHFSNLDSVLIGYAVDTFVGLPSFSYSAGLNLLNRGLMAYFINRLGAYRTDRRKKNPIYLETLKAMSRLSIQRGVNSLFFPGGTRSRSGKLESKLKLGFINTVVEAQRTLVETGKKDKIFIVPLILSYQFVLEGKYLIDQHLRLKGKERYVRTRDKSNSLRSILTFAWHSFSKASDITLAFGQPMDMIGNPVNEKGESFDQYGNLIRLEDYFKSGDRFNSDLQRDSEYTKILGQRIVERFHKDNIVLAGHLTAFAAFNVLRRAHPDLDLFEVLRLPVKEWTFDRAVLTDVVRQLQVELKDMQERGEIKLSEQIYWDPADLIEDGIKHLGSYHTEKPIKINRKKQIISESFKLLYYYHNRLENYQLDKKIKWT